MYYVYYLQSIRYKNRFYIGVAKDLKKRMSDHNAGNSIHTNKFKPWKLLLYIAFA